MTRNGQGQSCKVITVNLSLFAFPVRPWMLSGPMRDDKARVVYAACPPKLSHHHYKAIGCIRA